MNQEKVILVDENDQAIGVMEKMEAHEKALLHRAFSIFTFNNQGELLIHQRAHEKYHSGGLWTNTCCSHPREGETTLEAAKRRLQEEMGFVCELKEAFSFIYKAELDQGLTEHEYDHVFIGKFDGEPEINQSEVADWKYVNLENLKNDIVKNPDNYTVWFKIAIKELEKHALQLV